MHNRCSRLAYPVISHGLALLQRVEQGATLDVAREQAILKDLLLADETSARADSNEDAGFDGLVVQRPANQSFLGIRYALVCWLDELFTTRSSCAQEWNEHKLEVELYGSNDRAWKFWDQARIAQSRATTDALQIYYLCVMLGFRGALGAKPEQLNTWIAASRQRLGQVSEREDSLGGETTPQLCAPPLRGAARLRQMALTAWVAMLILGPLTAFYVVHQLGR
jgi:type VI secretion system protein ImpK